MPLQLLLLLLLLCPGIFGALYCLADVHTEFSEVAKQLKEVAELLGQGLNRQLSGPLVNEFLVRHWHALWFCTRACGVEGFGVVVVTHCGVASTATAVPQGRAVHHRCSTLVMGAAYRATAALCLLLHMLHSCLC